MGFVFQFYNLMPMLTAQRNVELPLAAHPSVRRAARSNALAALSWSALADRAKHKPARALRRPGAARGDRARARRRPAALLVCDEPTGDLDRKTADEILRLLQILNREHGKTIVMVTHDPKAAEFASRSAAHGQGRSCSSRRAAA